MFDNVGPTELIVLFVVVFLLFGSKKLPELGRGIGEVLRELRKSLKEKD